MKIRLAALRYFAAVVEAQSFAKAARRLGVSSSTLTRRVASLEDELGLTLLERGRSGVRLTSGGSRVMVEVRAVLAGVDAMVRTARCNSVGMAGRLRLGVRLPPIGEPIQRLLSEWRTQHPHVILTLYEMPDRELHMSLVNRQLDVAFLAGYGQWPSVVSVPLLHERLYVALPVNHQLMETERVDWAALRQETVLVQDWEDSHATREFYSSLIGIGGCISAHSASKQSMFALIGAGFGITLVPESHTQVRFPGVGYRPIDEENASSSVDLSWVPSAEDAVIGVFVSFLRDATRLSIASLAGSVPTQPGERPIGRHEARDHGAD